jgi:exodeoxyribonuclease V alpha subunit
MIEDINPDKSELVVTVDGRPVTCLFGGLDTLVPACAATIRKSRGSECPTVVIPVLTRPCAMLRRNPVYTGVTRAKRRVVRVGHKGAVAIAVRNLSGRRRWSKPDDRPNDKRLVQARKMDFRNPEDTRGKPDDL